MEVLDKGFVELINISGGDRSVLAAARVSNGLGPEEASKGQEKDQGLINYLMKHRHGTPFEHNLFTFYIKAPIFVAREWMRHRIGCLTGDTKITCVSPNGTGFKRTIKQIYDLKYGGVVDELPEERWYKNGITGRTRRVRHKVKNRVRVLPNCQERTFRVLDETTGNFVTGKMKDVWESGKKFVYELHLVGHESLIGTSEHMILTKEGWKKLGQLNNKDFIASDGLIAGAERPIPPSLRNGIGVWTTMMRGRLLRDEPCYICGQFFEREFLVLDHVIPVASDLKLALDEANLKPCCIDCHRLKTNSEQKLRQNKTKLGIRWIKVSYIEALGEKETYDIEVEAPNHNYMANGLVVHNSYNEISGRYTEFKPEFYIPDKFRIPAPSNKQGSNILNEEECGPADDWLKTQIQKMALQSFENYQHLLINGLAKEMARMVLPLNLYTHYYHTINARSLMNFMSLRSADNAMWEIRQYSLAMEDIFKEQMPMTYKAWIENGKLAP